MGWQPKAPPLDGRHPSVCQQDFRLPSLAERLAYRLSTEQVKNLIDSLFDPAAEWKRGASGEIDRPHKGRWYPMGALSLSYPKTIFYANGWGRHYDMLPHEAWLVRTVVEREFAPKPKPKPIALGWTEADEANERRLYEQGRTAFWLNPLRWANGPIMNLEEPPMLEGHEILAALAGRRPVDDHPRRYNIGLLPSPRPPAPFVSDRKPILATNLENGGLGYALAKD